MQSVSSRIWAHVIVSISYDDNHYTTGTSFSVIIPKYSLIKIASTYTSPIYDQIDLFENYLVCFGFMAYQPLLFI